MAELLSTMKSESPLLMGATTNVGETPTSTRVLCLALDDEFETAASEKKAQREGVQRRLLYDSDDPVCAVTLFTKEEEEEEEARAEMGNWKRFFLPDSPPPPLSMSPVVASIYRLALKAKKNLEKNACPVFLEEDHDDDNGGIQYECPHISALSPRSPCVRVEKTNINKNIDALKAIALAVSSVAVLAVFVYIDYT